MNFEREMMNLEKKKEEFVDKEVKKLKSEYLKGNFQNAFHNLLKDNSELIIKTNLRVLLINLVLQKLNQLFPEDNQILLYKDRFEKINFCYSLAADIILEFKNMPKENLSK